MREGSVNAKEVAKREREYRERMARYAESPRRLQQLQDAAASAESAAPHIKGAAAAANTGRARLAVLEAAEIAASLHTVVEAVRAKAGPAATAVATATPPVPALGKRKTAPGADDDETQQVKRASAPPLAPSPLSSMFSSESPRRQHRRPEGAAAEDKRSGGQARGAQGQRPAGTAAFFGSRS